VIETRIEIPTAQQTNLYGFGKGEGRYGSGSPTRTVLRQEFESWTEFVAHAESKPSDPTYSSSRQASATDAWDLRTGFDKSVKLAREGGWRKGIDTVKELSDAYVGATSELMERPEYLYDIEGESLDVARFLVGEPEVWLRQDDPRTTQAAGSRVIRIVVNCAYAGFTDGNAVLKRGAAIVALAQLLELSGHSVAVDAVLASGYAFVLETRVPIKSPGAAFDLDRITFAMAHPSFLRRLWFSSSEHMSRQDQIGMQVAGGSYGRPREIHPDSDHGEMYIEGMSNGGASMLHDTDEWVRESLWSMGVSLKTKREEAEKGATV
jgi:hypothetical protein